MKKYLSYFRIRFINSLQYRTAAYAGIATQFVWGFMEILLFSAFYNENPASFPMDFSALSSYVWLQQAFLAIFMLWFWDMDIFNLISNGTLAYELIRPADVYWMWFTKNAALRISAALLRCVPILVIASLLPSPYGLSLPASPVAFIMFLITGILSFMTVLSLCMIVYAGSVYTISPKGLMIIVTAASELLSGSLIPIPFMPDWLERILYFTPFASMQNLPLRIYGGDIAGTQMAGSVLLQIFWLLALMLLGRVMLSKGFKSAALQGG